MRIVLAAMILCLGGTAFAHGPADWINQGGYKNAAGELCCGERDCVELVDGDVRETAAGYQIYSLGQTVPFGRTLPSPDGRFWVCVWGGQIKCFFAPPPNT